MKSFARLLAEHTIDDQIRLGGQTFQLKRVAELDPLLDAISDDEFNQDERLPYWAELWPSALGLSEYILENTPIFANRSVIEIGCGLGLCGIAAASCGAEMMFTDYDELALEYTQENFFRNFKRPARVACMDWRQPDLTEKFDILIGSDVLYEKRWLEPVFKLIGLLLKDGGETFIAEPGRKIAQEFFHHLDITGCNYQKMSRKVVYGNEIRNVDIYRIKKC